MITHDDVLSTLCGQLNDSVTLVSRVVEPLLRIPSSTALLLLPDLHLITDAAADKYAGYHFRPEELGSLLDSVIAAANHFGDDVTRIQLGDRYDIWREQVVDSARPVGAVVSDIRDACQTFAGDMSTAQKWQFLAGNHDHELARPRDGSPSAAYQDAEDLIWLGASSSSGRDTTILALHGDTFDIIEQVFPAWLKKGILHTVGSGATETTKKISRDPSTVRQQPAGPSIDPKKFQQIPLPSYVVPNPQLPTVSTEAEVLQAAPDPTFNVYFFPSPNYYVLDPGGQDLTFLKAARSRTRDIAARFDRPAPKLAIIGHTHNPRIVVSRREDEQTPFILMDCGAWVEKLVSGEGREADHCFICPSWRRRWMRRPYLPAAIAGCARVRGEHPSVNRCASPEVTLGSLRPPRTLLTTLALAAVGCAGVSPIVVTQPPLASIQASGIFRAGAAEEDITPLPGLPIWGSSSEASGDATGYRGRLFVRAIALEDSVGTRLVLVQADLGAMSGLLHRVVAQDLAKLGIGPDSLLMAATHTHAAPAGYFGSRFYNTWAAARPGFDQDVLEWLRERTVRAVTTAIERLAPAVVGSTTVRVEDVSRNRSRVPWEQNFSPHVPPIDREDVDRNFYILRVDRVGTSGNTPIAFFGVFAVHGTAAGLRNPETRNLYHGDIHGAAAEVLRRLLVKTFAARDIVVAIANGAEGDVSPNWTGFPVGDGEGPREVDRLGGILATRALEGFASINTTSDVRLQVGYREVPIVGPEKPAELCAPLVGVPSMVGAEDARSFLYGILCEEQIRRATGGCQGAKREALGVVQNLILQSEAFTQIAPVQFFAVGDVFFMLGLPGEPTTETGEEVRKAVRPFAANGPIAVVAHSNEYLGYIATKPEYAMQNYEGGSTIYGPNESAFFVAQSKAIAASAVTGLPHTAPPRQTFSPGPTARFWGSTLPCEPARWGALGDVALASEIVFRWNGMRDGERCPRLPTVTVSCEGTPLLDSLGVPEDDRTGRMRVYRSDSSTWELHWRPETLPPTPRLCQFQISLDVAPTLASPTFRLGP